MPVFRTTPSTSLTQSIARAVRSAGMADNPMLEMQADQAAASTAQHLSLAEKARAEADQMRRAEADRQNPAIATEFASRASGMTDVQGTRMSNYLKGVLEQPGPSDVDDAAAVGKEAQPFATAAPNVGDQQKRGFQTALAALVANRLATGHTNADQLTQATGNLQKQSLVEQAAEAPDVPTGNRLIAALSGKIREPFKTNAQGTVLNEETGALGEGSQLAGVVRKHVSAQAAKEGAAAGRESAHGDLYRAQTDNAKQGAGKPPSGYMWGPANPEGQPTLVRIPGGPADSAGGKLEGDALDMAADRYRLDGTLPPNLGRGTQGAANTVAVLNRAAAKAKDRGEDGEAARITQLANKANSMALGQLTKQETMVGAFEKNFTRNADLALEQSKKVNRTGVPVINRWILAGKKNVAGDPEVAQFDLYMKSAINEYTKIISGSMGNAAMAEGEIKKVEGLLNSAQTDAQVQAVIAGMKKETDNRMKGFTEQKAELTKSMRGAPAAAPEKPTPGKTAPAAANAKGWKLMKDAKGNQAYVSPDGKQFEEVP